MTRAEKTKMAKELAEALDAARMEKDKAAMNAIRKEVKATGLVWEVNQITSKLLVKHSNQYTKDLRAASKEKDIKKIKDLFARGKESPAFSRIAMEALVGSTKDNPGKIVY
jgi:uncharacterized protein with gpF-like domain